VKIIAVECNGCEAKFEILENFPKELLACPACDSKDLKLTPTEKEFSGCGGGCDSCSSCS
jgi:Zn finger protein HypA/HybF involved in hydrogenase expression